MNTADYADKWDYLPPVVQEALTPIIERPFPFDRL